MRASGGHRGRSSLLIAVAGAAIAAAPARAQESGGLFDGAPALRGARPVAASPVRQPVSGTLRGPVRADVTGTVRQDVGTLSPAAPAPRPRRVAEEDPYAPLGWRIGNLLVLPSIEQDAGYDTNPNRASGRSPGSFLTRTEGEVRLQSDWSRHALTGSLRGGYSYFSDVDDASRPDARGRLTYRHDISRQTQATAEARLSIDTERPGSPDLNANVRGRPVIAAYGVELGATHAFNRLAIGLRGSVDRTQYENAELTNGGRLDQSDRNYNTYALRLRSTYDASPALQPFVEVGIDTRQRDDKVDSSGFERSSQGVEGRVGARVELTRKVTGEVSAGYQVRTYDDPRLADLRGPVADAALVWSVTPLTEVRVALTSGLGETTLVGSSGTLLSRAGVEVSHDLRRNLTVTAGLAATRTDYRGADLTEDVVAGSLRVEYKLTRTLALRSSFTHERLTSTNPGSDYTANVYLVGLRLQR